MNHSGRFTLNAGFFPTIFHEIRWLNLSQDQQVGESKGKAKGKAKGKIKVD